MKAEYDDLYQMYGISLRIKVAELDVYCVFSHVKVCLNVIFLQFGGKI